MVRLHPDRVRAVVGVSVPYVKWPAPPTQVMRRIYGDRFFYILYFQEVGPAERELEADPRRTMAKFLWAASGDAAEARLAGDSAGAKGILDTMPDPPATLPVWLTAADIDHYAAQFARSGFFGPVSYYRNLDANYARVGDAGPEKVTMPSFFIGGDRDVVIAMDPAGVDRMRAALPDYRGDVILPGIGHWTQQEAPDAFNAALLGFLGDV
jgi:pimeloyl-ACP methyl ester carboxylesterase